VPNISVNFFADEATVPKDVAEREKQKYSKLGAVEVAVYRYSGWSIFLLPESYILRDLLIIAKLLYMHLNLLIPQQRERRKDSITSLRPTRSWTKQTTKRKFLRRH
jgi:hypothetical protein